MIDVWTNLTVVVISQHTPMSNHHIVNPKFTQYYMLIYHNKAGKRKDTQIEFYHKDITWTLGVKEIERKASKATSLMKKETVEESPLSKHIYSVGPG